MSSPLQLVAPDPVLSISGSALDLLLSEVVARGMSFRFRASGSSMTPFIRDGDVLTIAPQLTRELQTGDVAAVRHPATGKIVVHRIVASKVGGFVVQGDNAITSDGFVPKESILGVVTDVERRAKRVPLGFGPERHWIAFLARHDLLQPIIHQGSRMIPRFLRRILA